MTTIKGTIVFFGAIFIICIILVFHFIVIDPFMKERSYIKIEIKSSGTEEEYHYWKRELKRLYLRKIPIIGRFYID